MQNMRTCCVPFRSQTPGLMLSTVNSAQVTLMIGMCIILYKISKIRACCGEPGVICFMFFNNITSYSFYWPTATTAVGHNHDKEKNGSDLVSVMSDVFSLVCSSVCCNFYFGFHLTNHLIVTGEGGCLSSTLYMKSSICVIYNSSKSVFFKILILFWFCCEHRSCQWLNGFITGKDCELYSIIIND